MKKIQTIGVLFLFLAVAALSAGETVYLKVKIQGANVRSEPDLSASIVGTFPLGSILESNNKAGDWYEVAVLDEKGDKVSGYIHNSVVDVVSGAAAQPAQPAQPAVQETALPSYAPARPDPLGSASFGAGMIYFAPSDPDFKSIYHRGGYKYGAEIAVNLTKGLDLWVDGGYYTDTGSMSFAKEETKVTLIPIGGGLRYRLMRGNLQPYIGAGARYILFKESNVIGDVSSGGIGFVGKAGLMYFFGRNFGVEVHVAYSACKMKPDEFEFGVGGMELGAGIIF